ncbi:MAG: multifunctional oxoglutarate decarboxylase/oxoglutarate dehydrogenase thiamine pyrophosphate-binding subunit/dihydrolipoyllysine-residue succinyltransferase subunit [Ignavibacteriae bacterium]|nr:multifunctional oxoglutarate decarboxylase/oxoglutarate dehydrogenase thiamine pyrophosphate-binding subunit/dihydrolipoyllysine-residue succinyltransferase subunit [Ignavibacteriota bacterium]
MNIEDLTKTQKEKISEFGVNTWYVLELLNEYEKSPELVSEYWKNFFESLEIKSAYSKKEKKVNGEERILSKAEPKSTVAEKDIEKAVPIRGAGMKIIENMDSSLSIPVATSLRAIPVKVLEENRRILNNYFAKIGQGKVSFTHIVGWAIVKGLETVPVMNYAFGLINSEPQVIRRKEVNIGLAIDLIKKDGSRSLIVPNIKNANSMNFRQFYDAYNDIIKRSRVNKIEVSDFQDTTISLTNPGTIGTVSSNPRLMVGQGAIIATGSIDFPAGFQGATKDTISKLGISKIMNVTSTYDHRIIQGAESGLFLKKLNELLTGEDNFYDNLFSDLQVPTKPVQWKADNNPDDFGGIKNLSEIEKQAKAIQMINMYRVRGHLLSNLDPLNPKAQYHKELDPSYYGFTVWDYDREFITDGLGGYRTAKLRDILDMLHQTYCENIGVEYRHIQDPEEKLWLQNNMESIRNTPAYNSHIKRNILYKLIQAESFEKYIDKKYLGHKRFSLEGSETIIPVIDFLLNEAANDKVEEIMLGMAHRGRLNVLANIIGKPLYSIFSEFEDIVDSNSVQGSGDVKYHLGASGTYTTFYADRIKVSVASNPSHLEFVNPVVEGIVRAKQKNMGDTEKNKIIPVLIHGDAAFAGEGVVAETLNLSQLSGYSTGGTIHLIINNQIGFTTPPEDSRSSVYASDVAKMVQAPIFHVNGDYPESALWVTKLAYEYRMKFKKDVVVDILSYRRLGHNETDEPGFTQPIMYKLIKEHPSVMNLYKEELKKERVITDAEAEEMEKKVHSAMDIDYSKAHNGTKDFGGDIPLAVTDEMISSYKTDEPTGISTEKLNDIADKISTLPQGFKLHPKLSKFFETRKEFSSKDVKVDWSFAESLAFGSLLLEGNPVRLSGQDSARGTFSQRHVVVTDMNNGQEYIPLNFISDNQAIIEPLDSLLSEAAVLGFEFGYSTADPVTLVLWEAQFGDFANAAQVIIDNFIVSSYSKWKLPNNLVMLLPHGQEGQGSEHSSARLERFLTLCSDGNIFVANPTTPAQYFHLLRRQAKSKDRRPLVIMTPKSLLRHPDVKSPKQEFKSGSFKTVLDDDTAKKDKVKKIILTSGKIYYELNKYRTDNKIEDTAIIRIEQYYPHPKEELVTALMGYKNATTLKWVQEEPANMGAMAFMQLRLTEKNIPGKKIEFISRKSSASPAPGSYKVWNETQKKILSGAFE